MKGTFSPLVILHIIFAFFGSLSCVEAASKKRTIVTDDGLALAYTVFLNEDDNKPYIRGQFYLSVPYDPKDLKPWNDNNQIRICMEFGEQENYNTTRE